MKISFYDWCIQNGHRNLLDRWDYDLNKMSPKEYPFNTSVKIYFKCPCGKHSSTGTFLSIREKSGNYNIQCVGCNSFGQWGIDNVDIDFLDKYWDYDKNAMNPMDLPKKSNKPIYIKCQDRKYHGSYKVMPYDFVDKHIRCPFCHMRQIHPLDSLGTHYPQSLTFWSEKNNDTPFDIAPKSNRKRLFKCENNKHQDYFSYVYRAVDRNFECPKCHQEQDKSYLHKKVERYLDGAYTYHRNTEYDCTLVTINPLTGYILPYDIEVVINENQSLYIEVQGKQHFQICLLTKKVASEKGCTPEEELVNLMFRDKIKRDNVLKNNQYYLAIPYWTEHDDSYKSLIDSAIHKILTQQND
jgi:transcription elongation factor Elf1